DLRARAAGRARTRVRLPDPRLPHPLRLKVQRTLDDHRLPLRLPLGWSRRLDPVVALSIERLRIRLRSVAERPLPTAPALRDRDPHGHHVLLRGLDDLLGQ